MMPAGARPHCALAHAQRPLFADAQTMPPRLPYRGVLRAEMPHPRRIGGHAVHKLETPMQINAVASSVAGARARAVPDRRRAAAAPRRYPPVRSADQQFITMLDAYRDTGGIARVQELIQLCRSHGGPSVAVIAAWIDARAVICFEWRSDIWLPWFQFHHHDLIPHPQLEPVFAELGAVYDPWDTACWFAEPNPWLADRAPVDALLADLPGVLQAARVDHFIANG